MHIKHPFFFSVLAIAFSAACSGSVGGGGSGGSGGSQGEGGAGGSSTAGAGGSTSGTGGSTSTGIQCTGTTPMFPTFDKTCTAAGDCVTKFHMVDCCGTRVAIGMNASEGAAFDQAEAICEAMYPGCGCAPMATKAEDGKTALDEGTIQVDCLSGSCSTFIP